VRLQIVHSPSFEGLEREIQTAREAGWQVCGSPHFAVVFHELTAASMDSSEPREQLLQTMVKKDQSCGR